MARRCPDCDQRLLEDEQVCWQCGARLEQPPEATPADTQLGAKPERSDQSMLVYSAIAAATILVALLMTSFLGRQPRAQISPASLPQGWVIVTDEARTFALSLPQDWPVVDRQVAGEQLARMLAAQDLYERSLQPLAGFVEDEEIVFLASGARPSIFLVAARSTVLNRLTAADAVALASDGDASLLEARELESEGGAQAVFRVELEGAASGERALCRQRFMPGEGEALLISLCAPAGTLSEEAASNILSSIQQLQ